MRFDNTINSIFKEDNEFVARIDQQNFIFKTIFFNPDNNLIPLPQQSLKTLTINDNIFEPFDKGSIIFTNNQNAFERFTLVNQDVEFSPSKTTQFGSYNFRGDGRDLIFLEIKPQEIGNTVMDDDFYKVYGYKNTFCIYDEENIIEADQTNTYKKYDFYDFDEQLLKEKSLFFSSVKVGNQDLNSIFKNNKNREINTSECIKTILKDGLFEDDNSQIFEIDKEQNIVNFENGLTNIFYTSPPNNSAYDDLSYILKHHVSGEPGYDFSFLKKGNYTGQFSLQSLSEIYKKAFNPDTDTPGQYLLERITITNAGDTSNDLIQNADKSPKDVPSFGEKSSALNYKFFNTSAIVNTKSVNSKVVHSYDYAKKLFQIETFKSNIENAKKTFDSLYVENRVKGKDNDPYPNIILNNTKIQNFNYENTFSLYGDNENIRLTQGINKLLKSAFLTNIGVEIFIKGQTFRKSGRFFTLDRAENYPDNTLDKKMLGTYLILNVEHIFNGDNTYFNKIIGVKTYTFEDLKYTQDVL